MFEYAFADTVDFDLGREVPAALRAFMLAYKPFFFPGITIFLCFELRLPCLC